MPELTVRYERKGIHLPALGLWLDPATRQTGPDRVVISHGHADHLGAHREVILTEPTAWFMHARLNGKRLEHILPFGQSQAGQGPAGDYRLTLLPAGHVLGSAMAFIETKDASLLYTGDFKRRAGLCAEPCAPRQADILIMETTFGRPQYHFPAPAELMPGIKSFCHAVLEAGKTPVLIAYSLGKSQDLLRGLGDAGLSLMVHAQVDKMTRIYRHFGQIFSPYAVFDAAQAANKVLIWPPQADRTPLLALGSMVQTAMFTGWAIDPGFRFRSGADSAFPLSDHADFEELIEMVRQVRPRRVYTVHGFAADFAQTLRERGYDARALSEEDQLWLPLSP